MCVVPCAYHQEDPLVVELVFLVVFLWHHGGAVVVLMVLAGSMEMVQLGRVMGEASWSILSSQLLLQRR
jgi:hypothetical protein